MLAHSWDVVPSIKGSFIPCEGESPHFEVRLGKLQIVSYQMVKVVKVQILIGSAWLGMVLPVPRSGMAKFVVFC